MTHQAKGYEAFEFQDDSNIQRPPTSLDDMGCFYLLFRGAMICVKELKTVCRNAIGRRRDSTYNNEESVSLLTDIMEEDADYDNITTTTTTSPTQENMDSIEKITALDKAMENFVETNNPQALLHVFDVALKDDKQD